MIAAILITSNSRQFVLTPQSKEEKLILDLLPDTDEKFPCEIKTGPFCVAETEIINHTMDNSTMLIFETVEKKKGNIENKKIDKIMKEMVLESKGPDLCLGGKGK